MVHKRDVVRLLEMKSILNGQVNIKVELAPNIVTSVGIVYAPEVIKQNVEKIDQKLQI